MASFVFVLFIFQISLYVKDNINLLNKDQQMQADDLSEDEEEEQQANPLLKRTVKYRSFTSLVLMVLNICMSPLYFGYSIQYVGTFDI